MKIHHAMLQRLIKFGLLLMMGASMNAEAGLFGLGGTSWKEEVLLHDGRKIIVERKDIHDSSLPHEIGQGAPLAEHTTTFNIPDTKQSVTWRSDNRSRSEPDNLSLIVLDFVKGVPYAAAGITRCFAYTRWGRPNPPYVFFKHDGKAWQRIPLEEFPAEFKEPNIMAGGYDQYSLTDKERHASVLAADTVRRVNKAAGRSPESYTIIREPLPEGNGCPVPSNAAAKLIAPEIDGKPLYYNWWPLATDWLKNQCPNCDQSPINNK